VADHTERLDRIEIKLDNVATDVSKIVGTLDGLAKLINRHDEEIVAINHNHRMLDHRVEVLEQKV
jgi:archaellum component FlaC